MDPVLPGLNPWAWHDFPVPFQRVGVTRAIRRRNFHLWWACGAGKTWAGIVWALASPHPILVVTRACARMQWRLDGFDRFTSVETHTLLPMSDRAKGYETLAAYLLRKRLTGGRVAVIAAWDAVTDPGLRAELDYLLQFSPSIVFDESHVAKNHKLWKRRALIDPTLAKIAEVTKEAEAVGGFVVKDKETDEWVAMTPAPSIAGQAARIAPFASRRLALTATPGYDSRRDYWAQLNLIEPGMHGRYWDWARQFCGATEGEYGMEDDGLTNTEALLGILSTRTHEVTSEEVWRYLPPCERKLTVVPLEAQGKEEGSYKGAAKNAGGKIDAYGESGDAYRALVFGVLATRKRPAVVEEVAGRLRQGQKCLVFTGLRDDAEKTAEKLTKETGGRFAIWMAHGDTSSTERARIAREYMAHPGPCCIAGTSAAWSESISLHDTDYLGVVQTPWTWGQIRQIEGRVRRLGQKRRTTIEYWCAAGTRDMKIYDIVRPKLAAQETLSRDSHIRDVREAFAGGSHRSLLDSIFDDIVEGRMKETDILGDWQELEAA